MKLVHIYIQEHKAVRDLNVSLGGGVDCFVDGHEVKIEYRVDTSSYYNGYHCSAIIGPNGVGKSSILDFLESVYFSTDSSGVLVFLDEQLNVHIYQVNYRIFECSLPFELYDDHQALADFFKISLVKINNVSVAQSRFGYEKKSSHAMIQERSLERYAATKGRRKKYFDNLLGYLRWDQSGRDVVQDVGFEFKIQSSFRRMESLIRPNAYSKEYWLKFNDSYRNILERRNSRWISTKKELYEHLVENLSVSIIVELVGLSGRSDPEVLAAMCYYFVKSLSVSDINFPQSIIHALEALRYEENWEIFYERGAADSRGSMVGHHDIDINKMRAAYVNYLEALSDVSQSLSFGQVSIDDKQSLVALVDEFSSASNVVYLASRLPRNILSNINWGWRGVSTGEMAYTHLFSETYNSSKKSKAGNYIILIDEADLYLHPEWQRSFLDSYLQLLDSLAWRGAKPQLLITTHSPIIISDFLPQDIVSLVREDDGQVLVTKSLGFGTNITNLFVDGMHIKSTIGEHSRKVIVELVKKSEARSLSDLDRELVKGMGNRFVREYLLKND